MEKKEIRKLVFQRRKEVSEAWQHEQTEKICRQVIASEEFRKADTVFVYMDCKGEAGTKPVIEEAWRLGKKVAAPKIVGPTEMKFYYIHSYEDVEKGYFDVPEPTTGELAQEEDALILVPGVAFDANRHRCGYGKGFYDRYLSAHPQHSTIAIAFDFQLLEEVPSDEFDVLPQKIITEKRVIC
ncbi:MAG: 5-formyltetrahydrofolate cyclo-ligase [Eubacteriales bacterium]|nr:5-formyltetrahydrofolate cyclo-ligase [Eubacteriales bacterium]